MRGCEGNVQVRAHTQLAILSADLWFTLSNFHDFISSLHSRFTLTNVFKHPSLLYPQNTLSFHSHNYCTPPLHLLSLSRYPSTSTSPIHSSVFHSPPSWSSTNSNSYKQLLRNNHAPKEEHVKARRQGYQFCLLRTWATLGWRQGDFEEQQTQGERTLVSIGAYLLTFRRRQKTQMMTIMIPRKSGKLRKARSARWVNCENVWRLFWRFWKDWRLRWRWWLPWGWGTRKARSQSWSNRAVFQDTNAFRSAQRILQVRRGSCFSRAWCVRQWPWTETRANTTWRRTQGYLVKGVCHWIQLGKKSRTRCRRQHCKLNLRLWLKIRIISE